LSSEKCCHIRLSLLACKNPVNYHISDVAVNTFDIVRDLGIDNKITFVEHINLIKVALCNRADYYIFIMWFLLSFFLLFFFA